MLVLETTIVAPLEQQGKRRRLTVEHLVVWPGANTQLAEPHWTVCSEEQPIRPLVWANYLLKVLMPSMGGPPTDMTEIWKHNQMKPWEFESEAHRLDFVEVWESDWLWCLYCNSNPCFLWAEVICTAFVSVNSVLKSKFRGVQLWHLWQAVKSQHLMPHSSPAQSFVISKSFDM